MTARILVVDDLEPNVKLLEAKLMAEYFEVITALRGADALALADEEQPDLILLDVMMPEMDGFEVCRRLKENPKTEHIPVIMVTALDQQSDRVTGLEAGAEDFLTKPVEDVALFARVKSLARLKMMTDELRLRESTGRDLGVLPAGDADDEMMKARILVIDDQSHQSGQIKDVLEDSHELQIESNGDAALNMARSGEFDLFVVNLAIGDTDGLRLCSQIRSMDQTRTTPILIVVGQEETRRLVRALEMGVNDYLTRPVERHELRARVRTQIKRRRYTERIRSTFQESLELAVTDSLTGLYNRRYLGNHLMSMFTKTMEAKKSLSVLFLDIDHFKTINDTYGHDVGDIVLKEFAKRLSSNVRGVDLACRYGGEEFVVVMPDTDASFACMVAERLRQDIADEAVRLPGGRELDVTVSIGVAAASSEDGPNSPQELMKRADEALYEAKNSGRNQVIVDAA